MHLHEKEEKARETVLRHKAMFRKIFLCRLETSWFPSGKKIIFPGAFTLCRSFIEVDAKARAKGLKVKDAQVWSVRSKERSGHHHVGCSNNGPSCRDRVG